MPRNCDSEVLVKLGLVEKYCATVWIMEPVGRWERRFAVADTAMMMVLRTSMSSGVISGMEELDMM